MTQLESLILLPMPVYSLLEEEIFSTTHPQPWPKFRHAFQLHILRNEKACFYKLVWVIG